MKRLLLVRHGETAWNARNIFQGQEDIALSARGERQATAMAPIVRELGPSRAFASDLARARRTAALLGFPEAAPMAAWREADLGTWTGRSKDEVRQENSDAYQAWRDGRYDPPGAEPWERLKQRIAGALKGLSADDGVTLVVTHGGAIRAACALLIGLGPDRIIPVDPGSITIFDLNGSPRLKAFNLTADLSGGDPPD